MIKRLNNYILNSIKVAFMGFCWFILFQIPYEKLPNASLGGKLIACVMLWAIWSFMVMIVSGELDKNGQKKVNQMRSKKNERSIWTRSVQCVHI